MIGKKTNIEPCGSPVWNFVPCLIKRVGSVCFAICFILFFQFRSSAATITSTGSGGNWSLGTSWVGGVAPVSTDDVIIVNGATINVASSSACLSITINSGGTLVLGALQNLDVNANCGVEQIS